MLEDDGCVFLQCTLSVWAGGLLFSALVMKMRKCLAILQPLMDGFGPVESIVLTRTTRSATTRDCGCPSLAWRAGKI